MLLRNLDELTLADAHFTARLVVESEHPGARYTRSLLVFDKEKFHSEFPMGSDTSEFLVGGKDSQLKVGDTNQFEILVRDGVLTLAAKEVASGTTLNGQPITSDKTLNDGDFIYLGEKSILVNSSSKTTDFYSGPAMEETVNPLEINEISDPQAMDDAGGEEIYPQQSPPLMTSQSSSPTWESKAKAGNVQNRRFIFGDDADSDARTIALPKENNPFRSKQSGKVAQPIPGNQSGFEMSLSGRMANVPTDNEASFAKEQQRRVILGVIFIAFALILGLGVIVMVVLN